MEHHALRGLVADAGQAPEGVDELLDERTVLLHLYPVLKKAA
jgi:hypothetical protein